MRFGVRTIGLTVAPDRFPRFLIDNDTEWRWVAGRARPRFRGRLDHQFHQTEYSFQPKSHPDFSRELKFRLDADRLLGDTPFVSSLPGSVTVARLTLTQLV